MSIPLYLRARELSLRSPLKAVLKELAFIAYDDGKCPPYSVGAIAAWTGLSRRAVGLLLNELCAAGYIELVTALRCGQGRPAEYRVTTERLPRRPDSAQPVRTNGGDNANTVRTNVSDSAQPAQISAHATQISAQPTRDSAHPVRTLDIDITDKNRPAAGRSNGNGNKDAAVPELSKFTSDELQMMWRQARGRNEQGRLAEITAEIARRTNA